MAMRPRSSRLAAGACALAATIGGVAGVSAQRGAVNGEWRAWAGDPGSTRYAPLGQIDASNFSKLEIAWRFRTENLGPRRDYNLQATPLMANGVLYFTAGAHRNAVAVDAATGELLWVHRLDEGRRAELSSRRMSGRGVGYWTDGKGEERTFYVTSGYQLVGLDAKTGRPLADFGTKASSICAATPTRNWISSTPTSRGTARRSSAATSSSSARHIAPARRRAARSTRRASSAATTPAPASGCGSSTPSRGPANSATTPGSRTHGPTPATPASGAR
jgi:glucose dehydrogenase